jgi:hypothetical protein
MSETSHSQIARQVMTMPDPFGITLMCPKCGYPLAYVRSEGPAEIYQAMHFYRCLPHGVVILPPSGIVRVDDPDDSAVRH